MGSTLGELEPLQHAEAAETIRVEQCLGFSNATAHRHRGKIRVCRRTLPLRSTFGHESIDAVPTQKLGLR